MKPDIWYTISARGKKESLGMESYLESFFPSIPTAQIDSVFGFVEPSTLYSGRPFLGRQISDRDYRYMRQHNIGLRIPVSNHFVNEEELENNRPIFEKYHEQGNSLIIANDYLARWIKDHYPKYRIEASILRDILSYRDISDALEIYDTVVLPMELNQKTEFLRGIEDKSRITLFANAGCALTCPDRICYERISRINKKLPVKQGLLRSLYFFFSLAVRNNWCMNRLRPRRLLGMVDFDLDELYDLGFRRFKMLREHRERNTGY